MKTKAYVTYLSKIPVYQNDIEFMDAMKYGTVAPNKLKHQRLSRVSLKNSDKLRMFTHLKSTVYGALMKRLYELMMEYFRAIVNCLLVNGIKTDRLLGSECQKMTEREVLQAGSWESVCQMIASNMLRSLENKHDTEKLITTINSRLNLGISKKIFDAAKPYIEVRHLLVHNSGMADTHFMAKYAGVVRVGLDGSLSVDYKLVQDAMRASGKMIEEYDRALVGTDLLPASFLQR